jgi:hypothetical protein
MPVCLRDPRVKNVGYGIFSEEGVAFIMNSYLQYFSKDFIKDRLFWGCWHDCQHTTQVLDVWNIDLLLGDVYEELFSQFLLV